MTGTEFETRLRDRLKRWQPWYCDSPKGISPADITGLLGIPVDELPGIYVTFLRVCGSDPGKLFSDLHWSPESRKARNGVLQRAAEEYEFELPPRLFTFVDDIGDFFWCFQLGEGDDPPVYRYDLDSIHRVGDHLSHFLLEWDQEEVPDYRLRDR